MRATGWIACILLLSACRLGFDEVMPVGDDGVIVTPPMSGSARVLVIGEDGEVDAGQPVADAYVVAIEQDGTATTIRTGTDGLATLSILGNTSIHVARPLAGDRWALSSFRGVNDGASIIAGGKPALAMASSRTLTVTLPAFPIGYDQAWITGPKRCLPDLATAVATSVPVKYDPQCDGQTVELFALAGDLYVPIGSVTLADGGLIDVSASASWLDLDKVNIDYTNVPPEVTSTYAFVSWPGSASDSIPMCEDADVPANGFAGLVFDIPPVVPGTELIHVFESPTGVRAMYERIDSWPGVRAFDAAMLPPAPPSPAVDTTSGQVQWTMGAAPPDADIYWTSTEITIGATTLYWNAFGPPDATQVTFPELPVDLSAIIPTPTSIWGTPNIVIAGLSELDYADILEFVDRDIYWWWAHGVYMPHGALSLTSTQPPP